MNIDKNINILTSKFNTGSFVFHLNEKLSKVLKKNQVPNQPGVYIVFGVTNNNRIIIYIGKSGTLKNNGEFRNQMLLGRLKARQKNMSREKYYKSIINKNNFESLFFQWFVTFDDDNKVLPAKVECDLLQIYYNKNKKLPLLNKEI